MHHPLPNHGFRSAEDFVKIVALPRLIRRFLILMSFVPLFLPGLGHAQTNPISLVAFGDSLTAGYQLPASAAFPTVLEKALRDKGYNIRVTNAGISGDTTIGGLQRLDWSIPDGTQGVILELGANDALRGLEPAKTEANLDAMLLRLKARKIPVLVAGIYAPRNNGTEYVTAFDGIYARLAAKHDLPLYPFFLEGVTGVDGMTLPDGMHPNAKGVAAMVEKMLPVVEAFVISLTK